ncbi:MAG TPA: zinc ABC transporter substrate-binding protein [Candidatus Caccousia avistercoris]|nr:zinc ABC transporter substrate-binding protein [Candidatus Caccousia avistercoris]
MKKKLLAALLAAVLMLVPGCAGRQREEPEFRVVTSFYPMYIMALNITDGVAGVQVDNMAGQQTGCLHDYQLQSKDMKSLEQADVFVINGAGMESFLDKVVQQLPGLEVVDSSQGISLLESGEPHSHEEGEEHSHEEEWNPHVWVSISNCIQQVENITEGLAQADPERAAQYRANGEAYAAKLAVLRDKMHQAIDPLPNKNIVTFHEAFPYFAEEFGLQIVKVVNREPDSQPSARELAETIRLVESAGVQAVFAEPQYPESAADIVAEESGIQVYTLDPGVTGENEKDAYLNAMEQNMQVLVQALS